MTVLELLAGGSLLLFLAVAAYYVVRFLWEVVQGHHCSPWNPWGGSSNSYSGC